MFKKSSFNNVFNIFLAFFIPLFVTLFLQIAGKSLTLENFVVSMIHGFTLNFTLETLIDLPGLGNRFVRLCGVKNMEGPAAYFLRILPIVVVIVLLMTLILMFCKVGFQLGAGFFGFWLSKIPAIFVVAYITAVIFLAPSMKLTGALCTKEG